eukprot:g21690.t1
MMRGMDRVNSQDGFVFAPSVGESKTRGERFEKNLRGNFITQRVVRVWNELPEEVVEAITIATFKRHLDGYMNRKGLEGYGP